LEGIGRRLILGKNVRPYLKKEPKEKRVGEWLKW
jgi:hypothetical protein